MPRFRWPTLSEWVLLFLGVAAVAIVGFSLLHAYNNIEQAGRHLEDAGHALERENPPEHR